MRGKVLVVHDDILSQEEFKAQNKLFVDAAKRMSISLDFVSNVQLYTYIDNSNVKCHETFGTYDYAIFFDKDFHLARNLEMLGVKVVNSAFAIDICENKANLYQILAQNHINIPKTVIFPMMTKFNKNKAILFLNNAISDLGMPIIVKEWYGDYGQNVYLCKSKEELYDLVEKLNGNMLLLQEFIVEASGSDIRLFVIKNKVVASYRRRNSGGEFRSNLSLGGSMDKYIPTYLDEQLAVGATKAVGCDFAIVDILKSINGPVVCEVNTSASVNHFYEACGVDIPQLLFKSIK